MTTLYARELEIALLAVQRASLLTKRVFLETSKGTVSKDDASPVTIGDFGAQALIISALRHNFPRDAIVAEEEAAQLRGDAKLRERIWELGQGAMSRPLGKGGLFEGVKIHMKEIKDMANASFCESVEAGHSNQSEAAQIAKKLGITKPSVRMDSQAKYGSIARGAGDIYLRLPTSKTYQEKIWDHAGGDLIVREAGGQVTDTKGNRLDFGVGRTLATNSGVIAAPAAVHGQVLKAVQEVLKL
ncbi:3'(2'),5'-bisphosphate nucleotidase [Collariella sp. IMI 366227]|nr:3'(2'),5'-bisphosphate nucleotidase [Collariella sp. IMI 366227]